MLDLLFIFTDQDSDLRLRSKGLDKLKQERATDVAWQAISFGLVFTFERSPVPRRKIDLGASDMLLCTIEETDVVGRRTYLSKYA